MSNELNHKDAYLELVKRFKRNCKSYPLYDEELLYTSFNDRFGNWNITKNEPLFKEIHAL